MLIESIKVHNGLMVHIYGNNGHEYIDNVRITDQFFTERLINNSLIDTTTLYIRVKNRQRQAGYEKFYFKYNGIYNSFIIDTSGCDISKYTYSKGVITIYIKLHKGSYCERLRDFFS